MPASRVSSARDLIGSARSALAPGAAHDQALRELDERLHEVGTLVGDLAADLTAYLDDVELDPQRLDHVQERRAALAGLTRKYGETIDEVLEWSGRAAARLDDLVRADDRVTALEAEVGVLRDDLVAASVRALASCGAGRPPTSARSSRRSSPTSPWAAPSSRSPCGTGSTPTVWSCPSGERVRLSRLGIDDVEILLAANRGAPPRTVAKAASGGELSRVMLALEVVGADRGALGAPGGRGRGPDGRPRRTLGSAHVRLRRGRRRRRRPRGPRRGRPARCPGRALAGHRRHPPRPGGRLRRPPPRRAQVRRRAGDLEQRHASSRATTGCGSCRG